MSRADSSPNQTNQSADPALYGGRALSQGVLMVGPHAMAVAIRRPDGQIDTAVEAFSMPFSWARKVIFLRGILAMAGAVVLAIRSAKLERRLVAKSSGGRMQMFKAALPIVGASAVERILTRALSRKNVPGANSGLLRIMMPFAAFRISSLFSPSNQLLQYHGAEHKAVNTVEAGLPLDAENASRRSRIHPRCGTSFAFWALSLGWLLPKLPVLRRRGVSPLLGPIIIGAAYELLRFGAKHRDEKWVQIAYWPAWRTQLLTTAEPTTEELEVACAALRSVVDFEALDEAGETV